MSYQLEACAVLAACCGLIFLPSLLKRTLGGGARFRRPSRERTLHDHRQQCLLQEAWTRTNRTILPWIAQETQYWSLRYIFGTAYSGKTEASEISPAESSKASAMLVPPGLPQELKSGVDVRIAADSTMLRMVNRFIALSLGVHLEQLEQRMGLT